MRPPCIVRDTTICVVHLCRLRSQQCQAPLSCRDFNVVGLASGAPPHAASTHCLVSASTRANWMESKLRSPAGANCRKLAVPKVQNEFRCLKVDRYVLEICLEPPASLSSTKSGWSQWWGLNPRPTVYETVALPLSYIGLRASLSMTSLDRSRDVGLGSWRTLAKKKRQ